LHHLRLFSKDVAPGARHLQGWFRKVGELLRIIQLQVRLVARGAKGAACPSGDNNHAILQAARSNAWVMGFPKSVPVVDDRAAQETLDPVADWFGKVFLHEK
jgi:hypothetical protein